jgi:hypothetical protein
MTTDYLEGDPERGPNAKAVRVTVSLSGTDESVIQNDNWLSAGITAQGPDSVHGGCNAIDWGYTFSLWYAPWMHPDPFVHAEVFEGHEWVNCHPGYSKCIYCWNKAVPGLTASSSATLSMEWTEDTLDYYVKVGGTRYLMTSYTPNETAKHYFTTGTKPREWWDGAPLGNTCKFLQFHGAWSDYNIGEVGWHSHLSWPGFIKKGGSSWTDVSFVYSTDGDNSYMDNTIGWGGDPYENVTADCSPQHAHFYPTSDGTTLEPDTLLWASHTLFISACFGGTTNPVPGTYAYPNGQSVSVEAKKEREGFEFHYWLKDGAVNYSNPIEVKMNSDHTLEAHFYSGGGGGEPCPTLFAWNGMDYVDYGAINIHNPSGEDVVREVPVLVEDVEVKNYVAKFRLREGWEGLNFSESVIDQVKLYADGKLCPLVKAIHSEEGNVYLRLLLSDEWTTKICLLETIDLQFIVPYLNAESFTFVIEGCNMLKP